MEPLSTALFNKICRGCLCSEELAFIFEITYEGIDLCEIFKNYIAIEIEREDKLPQNICKSCIMGLVQVYSFKQQCQQSDDLLRTIIKQEQNTSNPTKTVVEDASQEKLIVNENSPKQCDNYLNDNKAAPFQLRPRTKINIKNNLCTSSVEDSDWEFDEKREVQFTQNEDHSICNPKKTKSRKTRFKPKSNDNLSSYECKPCNESFDSYNKLKIHRKQVKHPPSRNYACPECYKPFSYTHLQIHMRTHTKEKPFQCRVCQMQFSLNCNLRRHMMTHTGERPHTCEICGKGFIQATTLIEHKRIHTGETPFVCSYCGKTFGRSGQHRAHLKKHLIKNGEFDKLMSKNHRCDVCHRFFATKGVLKTHMLIHGEKTFLCSHCGKGFVSNAGLLSHMKVHTGVKPYLCTVCNKSFSQIGSLKSHILIHTGQKPFICKVCSKAFTQPNHLKYHMRTHSGERPYTCSYCGKSFALNGTLTVHIRTHTGETPYMCDICEKGFYDSSSMKKHRRGHGQLNTKPEMTEQH